MMSINTYEKEFLETLKKISRYEQAINVMYWDMRTGAPIKGEESRAEAHRPIVGRRLSDENVPADERTIGCPHRAKTRSAFRYTESG